MVVKEVQFANVALKSRNPVIVGITEVDITRDLSASVVPNLILPYISSGVGFPGLKKVPNIFTI